jgi:hypothetical protein
VSENNILLRREVDRAKNEHMRLKEILESKRDSLKEVSYTSSLRPQTLVA